MIYSYQDFDRLETLTDEELNEEIEIAKEHLDEIQAYFKQLESEAENFMTLPNLNILFSNINNIEFYIRKAKNMLKVYDNNRKVLKAFNKRQIIIHSKKKKNFIKKTNLNIATNLGK